MDVDSRLDPRLRLEESSRLNDLISTIILAVHGHIPQEGRDPATLRYWEDEAINYVSQLSDSISFQASRDKWIFDRNELEEIEKLLHELETDVVDGRLRDIKEFPWLTSDILAENFLSVDHPCYPSVKAKGVSKVMLYGELFLIRHILLDARNSSAPEDEVAPAAAHHSEAKMKKYVDDKQGDSPNLIAFERLWNATSRAWENACGREDQRKLYHDLAELVDHLESNDLRNGHMHAILDDNLNWAGFDKPKRHDGFELLAIGLAENNYIHHPRNHPFSTALIDHRERSASVTSLQGHHRTRSNSPQMSLRKRQIYRL